MDLSKVSFISSLNYLKRSQFCSSGSNPPPINHNLGYIPFYEVYADFSNNGIIWAGEWINEWTDSSNTGQTQGFVAQSWTSTSTLTISTQGTAYWLVYLDYGDK